MRHTQLIMGMPITVEVADSSVKPSALEAVFDYFRAVDERFSTYKPTSEISKVNQGLTPAQWSADMRQVLALCEETRQATSGFFNISRNNQRDPSGLVKGWAIARAADLLHERGLHNFYIDAGGDIQLSGHNAQGRPWRVGIRNPQDRQQIVKVLALTECGVATSGTAIRGQHIYNPHDPGQTSTDWYSLTVIGPNIYHADRFATAAFAMGQPGMAFIENLDGFEAYAIDYNQQATYTTNFARYIA